MSDTKGLVAQDANGDELYYTVVYLGAVKLTPYAAEEVKEGSYVKATVKSAYADASDEIKELVAKHAKVTYTENADGTFTADAATAQVKLATNKTTSDAAAGDQITVTATCGDATTTATSYYVVPARKQLISDISLDKTTATAKFYDGTADVVETITVKATVVDANGKAAYKETVTYKIYNRAEENQAIAVVFAELDNSTTPAVEKVNATTIEENNVADKTNKVSKTHFSGVTWTSSDPDAVSVDEDGHVVIKKACSNVTITASAFTQAAAYTSSNDAVYTITKATDLKVATVNKNGKVTAKKTGKATITVTTASGKTAKGVVTVQKKAVTATKLTLNKTKVTLKAGKSVKLTVAKKPISATDKLTWTSSNKKVATVNKNGKVTAKKAGKATITVTTAKGKKATCKVTVSK